MADAVDPAGALAEDRPESQTAAAGAAPVAAPEAGERIIGRVLRFGALVSGGLFLLSVVLEAAAPSWATPELLNLVRGAAASILVVAPVARLMVSGVWLAFNREWRYAAAAAAVLLLLAFGMGLGWSH